MDAAAASALAVRGVRNEWLDGVTFELRAGESCALVTGDVRAAHSFARLVLGVERPAAGTIHVAGYDPAKESRRALQYIGFVPPSPDAPGWMRPRQSFDHLALHYPEWDEDFVEDRCEEWGVLPGRKFKHLAAADALRVQLLTALAYEPKLLLIDRCIETTALARPLAVREALADYCAAGGALLCVVGDGDAVAGVCDRVSILTAGKISPEVATDVD